MGNDRGWQPGLRNGTGISDLTAERGGTEEGVFRFSDWQCWSPRVSPQDGQALHVRLSL